MTQRRPARDQALLDRADTVKRVPFTQEVWRAVRADRDPLESSQVSGRWNIDTFEVLYAALEADGAIAEVHYHLTMQPVYPSQFNLDLHRLKVALQNCARFETLEQLEPFGVDPSRYRQPLYERTQEIGDAIAFLGFDGLITPSARWDCLNLTIFIDNIAPEQLRAEDGRRVDLDAWRRANQLALRRLNASSS